MRAIAVSRAKPLAWKCLTGMLLMIFTGCSEPTHVVWNDAQSTIEPEVPLPQGELDVYSESYVFYDGDVPRVHRRPVRVYSSDGQLVANTGDQDGEGPIHFALTPGYYIVASESRMQWREVKVDVQDGRDTVVSEARLEQAPLLASSETERPAQVAAHHPGSAR